MFKAIFIRELKGAFKSPMLYIFTVLVAFLCAAGVASDSVTIGGSVGAVYKNSPYVAAIYTTSFSLIGLLFTVAFFNNAALRDYKNNFDEIIFTTPLKKSSYFFGRFFGAFILSCIPFLGVGLGISVGTVLAPIFDWLPAERLTTVPWDAIIKSLLYFVLPNVFFSGALLFALAQTGRSTIISFVGALMLIIAYSITGTFLSDIENINLAALTDPFGIRTYSVSTRYFTTVDKNTLSPALEGLMLQNRLIWFSVGAIILAITYWRFSPQKNRKAWFTLSRKRKEETESTGAVGLMPKVAQVFGSRTAWQQFASFTKITTLSIYKHNVFKILAAFAAILVITDLAFSYEYFGIKSYPVTYKMVDLISNSSSLFLVITMVFFSGELVWRDRDAHIHEVISATPHSSFSKLLAYLVSLLAVCSGLYVLFIMLAVIAQLLNGFTAIELDLYLGSLFFDKLPYLLYLAAFHLFIQVLVNQKYVGYLVSILSLFVFDLVLSALDVNSNMLYLGSITNLFYSDLNGYGPGTDGVFWFSLYWSLFALFLLSLGGMIMHRYSISGIKQRVKTAKQNMAKSQLVSVISLLLLFLATASFVYYNTQVLNPSMSSDEREELSVAYENKLKKYEAYPLPKLKAIDYEIDIFPSKRDVHVKAHITYKNETDTPIDTLYYNLDGDWDTEFDIPNATLAWEDDYLDFKAFALNAPLLPGEVLKVSITNLLITQGFGEGMGNTSIVKNGTFLNNRSVLPSLGYNSNVELGDRNTRKKYGLKPKQRMPKLDSNCTDACMLNYLSEGRSDWTEVSTVISTSEGQMAIAPGTLEKQWTENGRNYYRYKVKKASQDFYAFISGDYEVAKRKWQGIDLEVYYHKKHPYNVENMLNAIERSLAYYTQNFGPYYHEQARIIEFPRFSTFAQAFPGTMPYSEAFGFIANLEDEEGNNVVDVVIAHEMAHQWWAHQEIPANMQGGTFLTEAFSQYSSLMVMKQTSDPIKMREFLKYDMDQYLGGRSRETEKELPLYKVENQGYIHYRKGSVVLYALQEMIGEDSVNTALRSFLEEYRYKEPPYPTSLDFMRHLKPRVPDSLHYLITDWIEEITLYDFRLERADYQKDEKGYTVDLEIFAQKFKADTLGSENEVDVNEWVEIGLYADADEKRLLHSEMIRINQNKQSYTVHLDSLPAKAAIDPRNIYIERISKDNVKTLAKQ